MQDWRLIERNLKYKAHRVRVYEDELIKPSGEKVYYDFVENRNGAGVLLIDDEGKLIFVKQYRNSINREDIEIPAGCAELTDFYDSDNGSDKESNINTRKNESPSASAIRRNSPGGNGVGESREDFENPENPFYKCAIREAEEETGLIPTKLTFVNYMVASVGLFSERTAIYIGTELKPGTLDRDSDEYIEIIRLTPDEALEYIKNGKIVDSKTVISIMYYMLCNKLN